jgi:RHS repeat-associated protein
VLVTVSDKRIAVDTDNDGIINYYNADVVTANDYYPFGMQMPGRKYNSGNGYRYGFNGKEKDNDAGEGNYAFETRMYDSRIGRFLSGDLLETKYSYQSTYVFAHDNPIALIDFLGMGDPPPDQNVNVSVNSDEPWWDIEFTSQVVTVEKSIIFPQGTRLTSQITMVKGFYDMDGPAGQPQIDYNSNHSITSYTIWTDISKDGTQSTTAIQLKTSAPVIDASNNTTGVYTGAGYLFEQSATAEGGNQLKITTGSDGSETYMMYAGKARFNLRLGIGDLYTSYKQKAIAYNNSNANTYDDYIAQKQADNANGIFAVVKDFFPIPFAGTIEEGLKRVGVQTSMGPSQYPKNILSTQWWSQQYNVRETPSGQVREKGISNYEVIRSIAN